MPFFRGTVVSVHNQANRGRVNGPNANKSNMTLCGRLADKKEAARLEVAPCFLPNFFAGPYWVLGVGPEYSWAVVIGGQPTEQYDDGCTTGESGVNHSGLWLLMRAREPSEATLDAMHALLKEQGVTTSRLHAVAHAGCTYEGAYIK